VEVTANQRPHPKKEARLFKCLRGEESEYFGGDFLFFCSIL